MAAFGSLVGQFEKLPAPDKRRSQFSYDDIAWEEVEALLRSYVTVMTNQAGLINRYRSSQNLGDLKAAWSYQTQRNQVYDHLRAELEDQNWGFGGATRAED
jgi:hypothetical protein